MKLRTTLTLVAAAAAPALAHAQGAAPRYELGADVGFSYSRGSIDAPGGDVDVTRTRLGAPVTLRMGFASQGPFTFEPRVLLDYDKVHLEDFGTATRTTFTPMLNVLYQQGKTVRFQRGLYFTGAIGVEYEKNADSESDEGSTVPVIQFGIGTRRGISQGSPRYEGFVGYSFEDEDHGKPSFLTLGLRAGLSFWK